jgi:RNA polymerase sigma-70 factor (ECF subfamily)
LFNFEREYSPEDVVSERHAAERSLQERQRDVYDTHKHRTFAVAFYMTGNELQAEQVLTDTFVRAFRAAPEPDGHGVDVAMVEELRERVPLDQPAAPVTASPSDTLGGRNIKRTELEEALQELPANERIVFLLRDVEGYGPERVADLLNVGRGQVERTLLSARVRLRRALAAGNGNFEAAA